MIKKKKKRSIYFSSMWMRIFFSFCMMLLVSLPDTDTGEGLRVSASVTMTLGGADSSATPDTGDSCNSHQFNLLKQNYIAIS